MSVGEERFANFFANTPAATTPIGSAPMLVLQGGITKQVPANQVTVIPPIRTILTANTNYYVTTSGSDANDGSFAHPWATLQHAMNFIAESLDISGFFITVNIGAGNFAGFGLITTSGGGTILFLGAGSTSTFIQDGPNDGINNGGECFSVYNSSGGTKYQFDKLTFRPLLDPFSVLDVFNSIDLQLFGTVPTPDVVFDITHSTGGGATVVWLDFPGSQVIDKGLAFKTGGTANVFQVFSVEASTFYSVNISGGHSTVNGNLTCSVFMEVDTNAFVNASGGAYVVSGGAVTGQRFSLFGQAAIQTQSVTPGVLGPNFFPGSVAGTVDVTSVYDGFSSGILSESAANIFDQAHLTNSQAYRLYNTVDTITSPTNYERGIIDWTVNSNVLTIGTQHGGSGQSRPVYFVSDSGVYRFYCTANDPSFVLENQNFGLRGGSNISFGWTAAFNDATGTPDTGLNRRSPGVVQITNGAFGTGPGTILPSPTIFANLPASPAQGMMISITDGLAANCADGSCTTFGTHVTAGGGALKLNLWYNGANWTLMGI